MGRNTGKGPGRASPAEGISGLPLRVWTGVSLLLPPSDRVWVSRSPAIFISIPELICDLSLAHGHNPWGVREKTPITKLYFPLALTAASIALAGQAMSAEADSSKLTCRRCRHVGR